MISFFLIKSIFLTTAYVGPFAILGCIFSVRNALVLRRIRKQNFQKELVKELIEEVVAKEKEMIEAAIKQIRHDIREINGNLSFLAKKNKRTIRK